VLIFVTCAVCTDSAQVLFELRQARRIRSHFLNETETNYST